MYKLSMPKAGLVASQVHQMYELSMDEVDQVSGAYASSAQDSLAGMVLGATLGSIGGMWVCTLAGGIATGPIFGGIGALVGLIFGFFVGAIYGAIYGAVYGVDQVTTLANWFAGTMVTQPIPNSPLQ